MTLQRYYFLELKPSTDNASVRVSRQPSSAPSGIAQLRKSVDQSAVGLSDPMNLDDYIFPSSVGSPAGISPSSTEDTISTSANAVATAIPIKMKRGSHTQEAAILPPASAPIPPQHRHRNNEFDYVQRHVRKTSIDESRVSVSSHSGHLIPLSLPSCKTSNITDGLRTSASETTCRILSPGPGRCQYNDT